MCDLFLLGFPLRLSVLLTLGARIALGAFPQPYGPLSGGAYSGAPVAVSPDPLVAYQWGADAAYGILQTFSEPPKRASAALAAAVSHIETLTTAAFGSATASVTADALLMLDWGREHACWLELVVPGGVPAHVSLTAGISEYDAPRPGAFEAPVQRGDAMGELRLVTNAALYDGLRYAFLQFSFDTSQCPGGSCPPVPLSGVRRTCQVLPLNYTGAFATSGDPELEAIWYTGAFSVRVNALPGFFGSELLDRGDRAPPFQGDAHVSNKVGLAAFASPPLYTLAVAMLNFTDSAARAVHDSSIATYPLQWVCSVADYFQATGDAGVLSYFAASASAILDNATANAFTPDTPQDLRWSGWDDRLGSGFTNVNLTPEARRFYWMTTLRATHAFAHAAGSVPALASAARKYSAAGAALVARLRASAPEWWLEYGLHARAAAVLGGWTTPAERAAMLPAFNNSALICSLSNYDSAFLLEALGEVAGVEYATAMLRLCWGRQLAAGATCWWESTFFYDGMLSGGEDMDVVPGASTSACHAWGSGATAWMSRTLLGVAPTAPGYARFTVTPALGLGGPGGGLARVAGTVPTPSGAITVSANVTLSDDALTATARVDVSVAWGTVLDELRLPAALLQGPASPCARLVLASISFNGTGEVRSILPASDGYVHVAGGGSSLSVSAVYWRASCVLPPVTRAAFAPYPYAPFAPPTYPVSVAIDNTTHGLWRDAGYGSDGLVLLGYEVGAADWVRLPPYVASVNCSARRTLDRSGTGPAPLQDPTDAAKPRRLGAAQAGDLFSLALDVQRTGALSGLRSNAALSLWVDVARAAAPPPPPTPALISVYFACNSSLVVHLEDLDTRDALAPDVTLRAYAPPPAFGGATPPYNAGGLWGLEKGVWLRFVYDRSVRIRVYCVAGCSASVSAVLFDPPAAP